MWKKTNSAGAEGSTSPDQIAPELLICPGAVCNREGTSQEAMFGTPIRRRSLHRSSTVLTDLMIPEFARINLGGQFRSSIQLHHAHIHATVPPRTRTLLHTTRPGGDHKRLREKQERRTARRSRPCGLLGSPETNVGLGIRIAPALRVVPRSVNAVRQGAELTARWMLVPQRWQNRTKIAPTACRPVPMAGRG